MRTESRDARFNETRKLLDYGFNNYSYVDIVPENYRPEGMEEIPVVNGKEKTVAIRSEEPLTALVKKGEEELYEPELVLDENKLNEDGALEAPFEAGEQVGILTLSYQGEKEEAFLYPDQREEVAVVTETAVEKAGWFKLSMRAVGSFFSNIWTSVADSVKGLFS